MNCFNLIIFSLFIYLFLESLLFEFISESRVESFRFPTSNPIRLAFLNYMSIFMIFDPHSSRVCFKLNSISFISSP